MRNEQWEDCDNRVQRENARFFMEENFYEGQD